MSVVYAGSHSVTFTVGQISYNTHSDWHLIPSTKPAISLPEAYVNIIPIPGSRTAIDLTDYIGENRYGLRSGTMEFYINIDKWSNAEYAYRTISDALHGKKVNCVLSDDPAMVYSGRVRVGPLKPNPSYPSFDISYSFQSAIQDEDPEPEPSPIDPTPPDPDPESFDYEDYIHGTYGWSEYDGYYNRPVSVQITSDLVSGKYLKVLVDPYVYTYAGGQYNVVEGEEITSAHVRITSPSLYSEISIGDINYILMPESGSFSNFYFGTDLYPQPYRYFHVKYSFIDAPDESEVELGE